MQGHQYGPMHLMGQGEKTNNPKKAHEATWVRASPLKKTIYNTSIKWAGPSPINQHTFL